MNINTVYVLSCVFEWSEYSMWLTTTMYVWYAFIGTWVMDSTTIGTMVSDGENGVG